MLHLLRITSLPAPQRWLLTLFAAGQVGDWLTTELFLRLGVTEANPVAQPLVTTDGGIAGLSVKLALIAVVALYVIAQNRITPRLTRWFLMVAAGVTAAVVLYNTLLIVLALVAFR